MSRQIEEYLLSLKNELRGSDPATIQDALSDAEDHLRSALAVQTEKEPGISEETAMQSIIENFGNPEEIAAAYNEIEIRMRPALAKCQYSHKRSFWSRFFGVIAEPRAWGALLYMVLSLVTGVLYFSWAVTGLSTSIGLIVLIIGLPVFGLFLLSIRGLALIEGRIVEGLLGMQMPRRPIFIDRNLNLWERFKVLFLDSRTWLAILYMLLMLPLGIIYFTLFVTLMAVSLSFIASPILRMIFGPEFINYGDGLITNVVLPSPDYLIPVMVVVGVLLFFGSMHLAKGLGWLQARFAKTMLVRN